MAELDYLSLHELENTYYTTHIGTGCAKLGISWSTTYVFPLYLLFL